MGISTKMGDKGFSRLLTGERICKSEPRLICYGILDHLVSQLGQAKSLSSSAEVKSRIHLIQKDLFILGTELATHHKKLKRGIRKISAREIRTVEGLLGGLESMLPRQKTFIIPGDSPPSASLHISRTICRHLECLVVELYRKNEFTNNNALKYLNRLSDLLFMLARYEDEVGGYITIFVTARSKGEAEEIATSLVKKKLAAGANIIPYIRSIYRWKGKIWNEKELLMMIQTRAGKFEALKKEVKRLHSYEVPEIIALPITSGLQEYIGWISENTK